MKDGAFQGTVSKFRSFLASRNDSGSGPEGENRFTMIELGIILWIGSLIFTAIMLLKTNPMHVLDLLSWNAEPSLIPDFTEVLWKSYNGVAITKKLAYLPTTLAIFYLLSLLTPAVKEMSTYYLFTGDPLLEQFMVLMYVLVGLCLAASVYIMYKKITDRKQLLFLVMILLFSAPMVWDLERGNIMFLSLPLLFFYCFYYNSESKKVRYLALLALVIAASFKPYVIVFIILSVKDRMWRELSVLLVIGLAAIGALIAIYGGFDIIWKLLENYIFISERYSFVDGFKMNIMNTLGMTSAILGIDSLDALEPLVWVVMAGLLLHALTTKSYSLAVLSAFLIYVVYSNIAWEYLLIVFVIPMAMMCYYGEVEKNNHFRVIFICMTLVMIAVPLDIMLPIGLNSVSVTYYFDAIVIMVLSVILAITGYKGAIDFVRYSIIPRISPDRS